MKREPDKYPEISSYLPLIFWTKCEKCGNEFLWEKMWACVTGPFYGGVGQYKQYKYLCRSCAPTKEDAENIYNKVPKDLPPPPCAPPKRIISEDLKIIRRRNK